MNVHKICLCTMYVLILLLIQNDTCFEELQPAVTLSLDEEKFYEENLGGPKYLNSLLALTTPPSSPLLCCHHIKS